MKERLRKIEEQEQKIREATDRKNYQECEKFIGKCYKSKSLYSKKEECCIYMKVIGLDENCEHIGMNGSCQVFTFQKDQFGRISMGNDPGLDILHMRTFGSEIPEDEFKKAWNKILKEIKKLNK